MKEWVIDLLNAMLDLWEVVINNAYSVLTSSPDSYVNGEVWPIITTIHASMKVVGAALLVLFFFIGLARSAGNFAEMKRPEIIFRTFFVYIIAFLLVDRGMELMKWMLDLGIAIVRDVKEGANIWTVTLPNGETGLALALSVPQEVKESLETVPLIELIIALFGLVVAAVMSFTLLLTVIGRFFKIYIYMAFSPIAFATMSGEQTGQIGRTFLKSFAGVALEGAAMMLAFAISLELSDNIYISFAGDSPGGIAAVFEYVINTIFSISLVATLVKGCDQLISRMIGG